MTDIGRAVNSALGLRLRPGVLAKKITSYVVNSSGSFTVFEDGSEYEVTDWEECENLMPGNIMLFSPDGETMAAPEEFFEHFIEG